MAKHYDEQFKLDAINYRKEHPQLSVTAVCRNLGISNATYYKWQQAWNENNGDVLHRGSGNFESDEAKEIAKLKREIKNRDDALMILKKRWVFWLKKNRSNFQMC